MISYCRESLLLSSCVIRREGGGSEEGGGYVPNHEEQRKQRATKSKLLHSYREQIASALVGAPWRRAIKII